MPTQKRTKSKKKLPKRGIHKLPKRKNPHPEDGPLRIKFGKRTIAALRPPKVKPYYVKRDSETPCLFVRVTPSAKSFFWQKTIRRAQKRVNIGRFPEINVEQARAKAGDISADYVKGVDVQDTRKAQRDEMTLGELWLHYRDNRDRKRDNGEESTALEYQWESYFEKWKDKRLSEITYAKAQRMILNIRLGKGKRKGAPFHGNRIHSHGKGMFNHAISKLDWKGDNPFRFKKVQEKGRERSRKKGTRLYDKHDMAKFMEGLEACSEGMRILFLSSLYTGRRVGEVQAMRWADLNLKAGLWFLPKTKPGIPQQASLPKELVDLLEKRREKVEGEWVFPSPSKSGHVEEIKKAWQRVRKASGLPDLQARDLRRTYISWAQEAGVPIAAVQAQVGHADIATTARHYSTFSDSAHSGWVNATATSMTKAAQEK
jgi:integrase